MVTPAKPAAPAAATTTSTSKDDPAEAVKKLETKTKAVFVQSSTFSLLPLPSDCSAIADNRLRSNANNIARVANSQLVSADEKLHPLLSLKTGKAIDKFPSTSKDIAKLSCTFCFPTLH